MLLTCKAIPKHRICEKRYREHRICEDIIPRTQQRNEFIIQREMFTGLFEGATSNRAELDYKTRLDAPHRESLSFIYDSYMQYHGPNIVGFNDTVYLILPAIYHLSNTTAHLQLTVVPSLIAG